MDAFSEKLLAGLNEPQRAAALHRNGPLLVLAGPGSGKTRVITHRAVLLAHGGVNPRNILAITFTNKAASEMRTRIESLGVARGMWIYTFHALGVRLLREFAPLAGLQPGFTIYDDADQKQVLADAYEATGTRESMLRAEVAHGAIGDCKNRLITPDEYLANSDFPDHIAIARIYEAYEQILRQRNAVDFDDLLMKTALLLRRNAHIAEELNIRFQYSLIDEYQDTNRAQYVIARELTQHHGNICATGDPDQSIYAWRGADINNILAFERDYPDATVIRLEQNYRSHGRILEAADKLIACNTQRKPKTLWTERDAGEPVQVWRFMNDRDEAERIAATISEQQRQGRSFSDFAIFYRINAISRGLEDALRHRGIPYQIARGLEFYNRKEIKDALAYLRIIANPADDVALLRCINTPTRGIGKTTLERLMAEGANRRKPLLDVIRTAGAVNLSGPAAKGIAAFDAILRDVEKFAETNTIADTIDHLLRRSGLEVMYKAEEESGGEDRLANLRELVSAATRYEEEQIDDEEPSLRGFLTRVSLQSDQDVVDPTRGCVMLMTLHTSKGLEFPVVFVAGVEHGMLPHERSLRSEGDIEEERRLCFVGMTRAEQRLYLSFAENRLIRGQITPRCASQFLKEIQSGAGKDVVESCDFTDRFRSERRGIWADQTAGGEDDGGGWGRAASGISPGASRWRARDDDPGERVFSKDDAPQVRGFGKSAAPPAPLQGAGPYADWKAGMLVRHKTYGVGSIIWISPSSGQTRAAIKFAGVGEKTFVLDHAGIERLGA